MTEKPILFSAPMVKAILAGTKTQTRRIVKPQPDLGSYGWHWPSAKCRSMVTLGDASCLGPYGYKGDRLWVKETWATSLEVNGKAPSELEHPGDGYGWPVWYNADGAARWRGANSGGPGFTTRGKTRVSIHMTRWASRLTLEVVSVRIERLQDISEEDALAEGAPDTRGAWSPLPGELPIDNARGGPVEWYRNLWDEINGARQLGEQPIRVGDRVPWSGDKERSSSMTDEPISDEEFAALRARIEAKQEEFLKALQAVSGRPNADRPGGVGDNLFRLLGIVTFWLSIDDVPSKKRATMIAYNLDALKIEVVG